MAGFWCMCPCTSVTRTLSASITATPSGRGITKQYALDIQAPSLLSMVGPQDFLSFGSHARVQSFRTGSTLKRDQFGKSVSLRLGNNFKGWLRCSAIAEATEKAAGALPKEATEEDAGYMRMAVQLAKKAIGHTSPNPMVGCVIVKDGQIVGRGFHPKAGEPHAEVFALREAGEKAKGATAYVSLEPCNHTGRTPPCSQALVRAQVKRVVVGTVDPNPLVGGKGVRTLQTAGIEVLVGVEEALCQATAETFFHRIVTKKPFVTLRYLMSLDGTSLGSCEERTEAGTYYSRLLQEHDAVVVTDAGVFDNPSLLSSEPGAKQPLRVVYTKSLDLNLEAQVFDTTLAPTLVLTDGRALLKDVEINSRQNGMQSVESTLRSRDVDVVAVNELNLDSMLDLLYQRGFNSVLLDSRGPEFSGVENYLGQLAIPEQAAQKVVVVILPVIAGDKRGGLGFSVHDELLKLERVSTRVEGGNIIVEGYFPKIVLK